jgi:acyl carrier protein
MCRIYGLWENHNNPHCAGRKGYRQQFESEVIDMAVADPMHKVVFAIRHAGGDAVPPKVERDDSLVLHLGFDSMKMALLSLSLETEFGATIVLDGWIAAHPDPYDLTVGSLCDYVAYAMSSEPDVTGR